MDNAVFNPTFFVGLGGHGGKIVNLLAQKLRRRADWGTRLDPLMHFVAMDTDQDGLNKLNEITPDCRFTLSGFNRRDYQDRAFGRTAADADPMIAQWMAPPEAYHVKNPGAAGAGAGQIRMLSRMSVYYALEQDRIGVKRRVDSLIAKAISPNNPFVDPRKMVRFFVFGSVAGGTGSGAFLPMSYWLRDRVPTGWSGNLYLILTLPTLFEAKVGPAIYPDICANGYAALKELEYLNSTLGYDARAGGSDGVPFHFAPGERGKKTVTSRPANLTYLIDRPASMSLSNPEGAVADAVYLQVFSPLLTKTESELDNFEKHQASKAMGTFSTFYGAFGTNLLQFPRRDVLKYAAMRHTAHLMLANLSFGAERQVGPDGQPEPDFSVDYSDPKFQKLAEAEKARQIDDKFLAYVDYRKQQEDRAEEKGTFWAIKGESPVRGAEESGDEVNDGGLPWGPVVGDQHARLWDIVHVAFEHWMQHANRAADELGTVEVTQVMPTSADSAISALRQNYAQAQRTLDSQRQAIAATIGTTFFTRLFAENGVNPIAQRFFLTYLLRRTVNDRSFIPPCADVDVATSLASDSPRFEFSADEVRREQSRLNAMLTAADKSLLRRDQKVRDARNSAVRAINTGMVMPAVESMRRTFWQGIERALREAASSMLSTFRAVSELSMKEARQLADEAERFRIDPSTDPDSDIALYHMDAEALRDDRTKDRLWDCLYFHKLSNPIYFTRKDIYEQITLAFAPMPDAGGRMTPRDAAQVIRESRRRLQSLTEHTFTDVFAREHIDLQRALELEARYVRAGAAARYRASDAVGRKPLEPGQRAPERMNVVSASVDEVPSHQVTEGIKDRLTRINADCNVYATLNQLGESNDGPSVARPSYYALAKGFDSDEPTSLGAMMRDTVPGMQPADGWHNEDQLVLYRSVVNVPVYNFINVRGDLESHYKTIAARVHPSLSGEAGAGGYPLHIEWQWEMGPNALPNLNPEEIKAQREALALRSRYADFVKCFRSGFLSALPDGSVHWSYSGVSQVLAAKRQDAFKAFFTTFDMEMRTDILRDARAAWIAVTGNRADHEALRHDLDGRVALIRAMRAAAVVHKDDPLMSHLVLERQAVEALKAELDAI